MTDVIPVLTLRGPAHDRGVQYGRAAADQIHDGLWFYGQALAAAGLDAARLRAVTDDVTADIGRYDAAMLEELEGIALGAAVTLGEVISLNARSELMRLAEEGCTAVACLPESTADRHTLLAQNWDWHPTRRATSVLLRILPDDGPAILTFVEAGALARCGLNEHGIGVVGNALECLDGTRAHGVPVSLLRRRILGSSSLAEAVDAIRSAPRGTSANHLVASAEGAALSSEATPDQVFGVDPEDGLLTHSNHFLAAEATDAVVDTGIARTVDTLVRHTRLRELIEAGRPVTPETLEDALRDHDGHPVSICRHLDGPVHPRTWAMVAAVVMDLDARRLWLAPGPVCESEFVLHGLDPARATI